MMRGRFAPTPSGRLHLGSAWAAVCAWLQVRAAGGAFVLRIEDVDAARAREDAVQSIQADLRWLGLDWDEGPDLGGRYGPYRQSERTELYEAAFGTLKSRGLVYPCFCSRADLAAVSRAPHGLASEGPAYPGTCRGLTPGQQAERARRKPPAWRYHLPDEPIAFRDLALGEVAVPPGAGGDFIVKRADGVFGYQLAVVVDDALMRITHVLRGADLLDSTPRQLFLYRDLGYAAPAFAHVPLVTDARGERLAKRSHSIYLAAFRQAGAKPEQLLGWLAAQAGWLARPEPVRLAELLPIFNLQALPRDGLRMQVADLLP